MSQEKNMYYYTLADTTIQPSSNGGYYKVPISAYIKSQKDWVSRPMIVEHENSAVDLSFLGLKVGEQLGIIEECFMNNEGYTDHKGEHKEANGLPTIKFSLNEKGEKVKEYFKQPYFQGISNKIKCTKSHFTREVGKDVVVYDEIEPINVAMCFKTTPNYEVCRIEQNSSNINENKTPLTISKKNINNISDSNMADSNLENNTECNSELNNNTQPTQEQVGSDKLDAILACLSEIKDFLIKSHSTPASDGDALLEQNSEDKEEKNKKEDEKEDDKKPIEQNSSTEEIKDFFVQFENLEF